MKLLNRSEEIMLLTILKLGENAYGVKIKEMLDEETGEDWSFASIYTPLDKLTQKNYVIKKKGEATAERGGKSKFYYTVTTAGKQALKELQEAQSKLWEGIASGMLD